MRKTLLLSLLLPVFLNAQTLPPLPINYINGEAAGDRSGHSVSLSDDGAVVAIGAPYNDDNGISSGHVRIYRNSKGGWGQIGSDISGEAAGHLSGASVSLSSDGKIVAIGAPGNTKDAPGIVRIYKSLAITGGIGGVIKFSWRQIGSDIVGEAAGDQSGHSVSLSSDGTVVAIGAPSNDDNGNASGQVRIYRNVSGTWTQIGTDIDGEAAEDESGRSVSLSSDGTVVAIGAPSNDDNGVNSGHVRIYRNTKSGWIQMGTDINGKAVGHSSGRSVSLSSDGKIVAIGAPGSASAAPGIVSIYQFTPTVIGRGGSMEYAWRQIGSDIVGEAGGDQSGRSVSLSSDGTIVAIGANLNDDNGVNSGQVRIYKFIPGKVDRWVQTGSDIDGEASGDESGWSVSLSSDGRFAAIGAPYNDNNGVNSGQVRILNVRSVLGVSEEFVMQNFSVFPNPSNSIFTISLGNDLALKEVSLIDCSGRQVLKSTKLKIDISSISQGIYYLKVVTNKGIGIKKVIVE